MHRRATGFVSRWCCEQAGAKYTRVFLCYWYSGIAVHCVALWFLRTGRGKTETKTLEKRVSYLGLGDPLVAVNRFVHGDRGSHFRTAARAGLLRTTRTISTSSLEDEKADGCRVRWCCRVQTPRPNSTWTRSYCTTLMKLKSKPRRTPKHPILATKLCHWVGVLF